MVVHGYSSPSQIISHRGLSKDLITEHCPQMNSQMLSGDTLPLGPSACIFPCIHPLAQAFLTLKTLELPFAAVTGHPCALSLCCIPRRKQNGGKERQP